MIDFLGKFTDTELINVLFLSKNATAIYSTENIVIQTANDAMIALWGKNRSVIGKPMVEAIPELAGQPFIGILKNVWITGNSYEASETPAELIRDGKRQTFYFDFEYRAIKNRSGEIICILHTATEVTDRVINQDLLQLTKKQQEALEREQTLNEELAATVEELRAVNEELHDAQQNLHDLNADLEARVQDRTRKIQNSESRFRSLVKQIPVAINLFLTDELIIDLPNNRMLEIWDRTFSEVNGKPLAIAMPELEGQPFMQKLRNVISTGVAYSSIEEKAIIQRNGQLEECYFNIVYQPIVNADNTVNSLLQIVGEVTEEVVMRRKIQTLNEELAATNEELSATNEEQMAINEELQQTQNDYVTVYNQMEKNRQDLLFIIDAAGLATFDLNPVTGQFSGNDLLKSWFGLGPEDEIELQEAIDVIEEQDRKRISEAIAEALTFESGGRYDVEYTIVNSKNSERRVVKAKGKTQFNAKQQPFRLSGTLQDITEQKKDEQRKSDFIGMVSHELKTPLTSMSGYLQMLQTVAQKSLDDFSINLIDKANKQVGRMTTLINGFLNVSRLESGKIQIDKQRFDMAILVKDMEEETLSMYNNHRINFHPVEETFVNADRDKIGQVISNLISNAVKYSPPETIINVACITVNGYATLSVRDEGIGIKAEDTDKLFERYYRVNSDSAVSASGFGIGLYLCAEIIQRHDGRIWVESEIGKGSTFSFSLPVVK